MTADADGETYQRPNNDACPPAHPPKSSFESQVVYKLQTPQVQTIPTMSSSYLVLAARRGISADQLLDLLRQEGSQVDLDFSDAMGSTALHYASAGDNHSVVQVLVELGAHVHAQDRWGETPLHVACSKGDHESMCLLLQAGADPNAKDNFGKTPLKAFLLFWMSVGDQESSIPFFYKNKPDDSSIRTKSIEKLKEFGADINLAAPSDGTTALHFACKNGRYPMVRALLQNEASVTAVDENGETPLHYACARGDASIVRILMQYNANPNTRCTRRGKTPLHVACSNLGNVECIHCLISHGADYGSTTREGNPPIGLAANNLDMEVVQSMLCTVYAKCCFGYT